MGGKDIHAMIKERREMTPRESRIYDNAYKRGALAAAGIAGQYDSMTTHKYRLEDCVAGKLNVTKRSAPRRNKLALPHPAHARVLGIAEALDVVVRWGNRDATTLAVSTAAQLGITIYAMRMAGVPATTRHRLWKAGVK